MRETPDPERGPPALAAWLERNTLRGPAPSAHEVARLKGEARSSVAVCLPALNEAPTVGAICSAIRRDLMTECAVVDELIVLDSGSEDGTPELAARAGADVYVAADLISDRAPSGGIAGKGEALWKSLSVAKSDIVIWIDSDIRNFTAGFVTSLAAPLLEFPELVMSKAFYERPLETPLESDPKGGARVTELAARPLLQLLCPTLAGVIQPLSGEYALRRSAAMELPFITGYGVDAALLIDVVDRFGLEALVQVDIGRRLHRNRDLASLGRMSFQVMQAIILRLEAAGHIDVKELSTHMVQFIQADTAEPTHIELAVAERPPMNEVLAAL